MRASLFISLVLFSLAAHAQEVPPPTAVPQNIAQVQRELNQRMLNNQSGAIPRDSLLAHFHKTPIANDLIQRQQEQIQQQNERILRELEESGAIPPRPEVSSSPRDYQPAQSNHTDDLLTTAPNPHPMVSRVRAPSLDPDRQNKVQFGEFVPSTDSARKLREMYLAKDEDIDLAEANWLIAADMPEFSDMTREAYFAQLDAMTEQVRKEMERMKEIALSESKDVKTPSVRCSIFHNAVLTLKFGYAKELSSENLTLELRAMLLRDGNNTFLAGMLRTRRGTCVSMPLLYLVIGQRLGMPVHLVAVGQHYFIRWEEPGYRMNIETTIVEGPYVTSDDSTYLEVEGMKPDQVKGSTLRNLTRREVLGTLFFNRSIHSAAQNPPRATQQCFDLSRAYHLAPEDTAIKGSYERVFDYYGIKQEHPAIKAATTPPAHAPIQIIDQSTK